MSVTLIKSMASMALNSSIPILRSNYPVITVPVRGTKYNKKPCQKPKKKATIEAMIASLESRGFLRPYKGYKPPLDAKAKAENVLNNASLSPYNKVTMDKLSRKFQLFMNCAKEFEYYIPNSNLVEIKTKDDLKRFYTTPICTKTPFDKLWLMRKPENLHVIYHYHRFHPDKQDLFEGKTAFPKNATVVTGLKYVGKYRGYEKNETWLKQITCTLKNKMID